MSASRAAMLALIPFMRRVRVETPPEARPGERVAGLRAAEEEPRGIAAME